MTALANHLWQSTLVLLALWAATRMLHRHRAAVRHSLWLAGAVKFLLPFDLLFTLGRSFGPGFPGATSTPLAQAVEVASEPFSHPAVAVAAAVVSAPGPDPSTLPTGVILLSAWAIGFLPALVGWAIEWRRIAASARRCELAPDEMTELLARARARHGTSAAVQLAVCDSAVEPGIFGIWRPVLLWPRRLTAQLSPSEVEAILAHELCHVSRRDNLTGAVYALVNAAFWFYPVLRLVGRQLHLERERACDEEVLRRGYSPLVYAESIVKTCESCLPAHALAAGATGSLRERVVGILRGGSTAGLGYPQRAGLGLAAIAAVAIPVVFGAVAAPQLRAQAPAVAGGSPSFEVASVKQNTSTDTGRGFQASPGGRVNLTNLTLRELIFRAYQTQDHLIVGGPGWINSDRFDVAARAPDNAPLTQMLEMVRTLLADRFKLVMHRETREMPVYHLVLSRRDGRFGETLTPTTCVAGPPGAPGSDTRDDEGRFSCGVNRFGAGQVLLTGNTLDALANRLGSIPSVGRTVINRTGLDGRFDVELSFTPGLPEPGADAVSVFTAMEEQLGLRLEAARGPVEVLVIDSVDRPLPD